jgi:divalent metal cation (Fe/Co/Zn/Cd) transporter
MLCWPLRLCLSSIRGGFRTVSYNYERIPDESVFDEILGSKDPTVFTIFLEDSAGLMGTILAFLGIFLGHRFDNPYLDPAASILIGVLLAAVAVLLGRETGALLVGERTNRARIRGVQQIIAADPAVERIRELLTMQLGPEQALLTASIKFRQPLDLPQLESAVNRIKDRIRQQEPTMDRIFIEADPVTDMGDGNSKVA